MGKLKNAQVEVIESGDMMEFEEFMESWEELTQLDATEREDIHKLLGVK